MLLLANGALLKLFFLALGRLWRRHLERGGDCGDDQAWVLSRKLTKYLSITFSLFQRNHETEIDQRSLMFLPSRSKLSSNEFCPYVLCSAGFLSGYGSYLITWCVLILDAELLIASSYVSTTCSASKPSLWFACTLRGFTFSTQRFWAHIFSSEALT